MIGRIKCLKPKGFGFIIPEDGGKDIFFPAAELVAKNFDTLKEGDSVDFDTKTNAKGVIAINIKLIS